MEWQARSSHLQNTINGTVKGPSSFGAGITKGEDWVPYNKWKPMLMFGSWRVQEQVVAPIQSCFRLPRLHLGCTEDQGVRIHIKLLFSCIHSFIHSLTNSFIYLFYIPITDTNFPITELLPLPFSERVRPSRVSLPSGTY